jgi:hypothetical protein
MMRAAIARAWIALPVAVALWACSDVTKNLVSDHAGLTAQANDAGRARDASATRDASVTHDAGAKDASSAHGDGGHLTGAQCDDGIDNDGDGLIDGLDPECTGPFDNDESTFGTGLPNREGGKCRDCFWDNNNGPGDDGCYYANACLEGTSVKSGSCSCDVSAQCHDTCSPLTPNGCDCFGCCDVTGDDGVVVSVQLVDTCSVKNIGDTQACPRCVQSPDCRNPCGTCELCRGRKRSDLPASCSASTPTSADHTCDEGQQVCDVDSPCPQDFYCQLGCCVPVVE